MRTPSSSVVVENLPATSPLPAPAVASALPVPTPEIVRQQFLDDRLFRTNLVLFERARADLLPRSQEVLRVIGEVLRSFPAAQVRVEGHSDRRGSQDFNKALSQQRAEVVVEFLLDCCGLTPNQLIAKGYGESRPVSLGDTPTALALNRRVEFRILNPESLQR